MPLDLRNPQHTMTPGAGIVWMQLAFAVASGLLAWSVTGYTDFAWPLVLGASAFAFILGNVVILPLFLFFYIWCGGRFLSLVLACGFGAPLAWLLISPFDVVDVAFGRTSVADLLHISAIAVASVLIAGALRAGLKRLLRRRRASAALD